MRLETDSIGSMEVPGNSLGGIASMRAASIFSIAGISVNSDLIHAMGAVKLACLRANQKHVAWSTEKFRAIENACQELMSGKLDSWCSIDALQGGAGTSTNLNVNEVIANRACELLGHAPGSSSVVHPIEDVNLHQSTNDTFPTAIKIATLWKLKNLEKELIGLINSCQQKETSFAAVVKIGRTQLQDAVLTTLGRSFGAFADAFARDRWRIEKCRERVRVVNLGGTAIGTGIGAPKQYIFSVTDYLREIAAVPVARSENLIDATQNCDPFVEVMGMLKVYATNLCKISNDLRLLSSGPEAGLGEIVLPALQTGSSIMPGKINPVIPESVMQSAMLVMGYEQSLSMAVSLGNLELNAFLPLIAHTLLHSLDILTKATSSLSEQCINGITANTERCAEHVEACSSTATALVPVIGYDAATNVANCAKSEQKSIRTIILEKSILSENEFNEAISPDAVVRLGHNKSGSSKEHK